MDFEEWRHYLRGRLYERLRKPAQAAQEYLVCLRRNPHSAKVRNALGYLHANQEQYDQALPYFEEAVRLAPNRADTLFDLGFVRHKLGRLEQAIDAFRKSAELNSKLDRAWYGLGMCLAGLGRHAEAVDALEQAAQLQPMNPHAWYALGMAYHSVHQPNKVSEVVYHLFRFDPVMTRRLIQETERADLAHLVKDLRV